jgi:hypothetical protein
MLLSFHRRRRALGWEPRTRFADGLAQTVDWYRASAWWWEPIRSGDYHAYYEGEYGPRSGGRLGPRIFSRGRSVRQLRSPPVERDDPQREFERASIERLSELGDSYEIVA